MVVVGSVDSVFVGGESEDVSETVVEDDDEDSSRRLLAGFVVIVFKDFELLDVVKVMVLDSGID